MAKKPAQSAQSAQPSRTGAQKQSLGGINGLGTTSRMNLFSRLFSSLRNGFMFGGERDFYKVYGYKRDLNPEDLLAKYERQDITSRIVNTPVEETWAYPPKIKSDDKVFAESWDSLKSQVWASGLWPALTQADKLCAFGEFSVLWIGLPGSPANPAPGNVVSERIGYLTAYGATNAKIDEFEIDPQNPRFGMPKIYSLKTSDASTTTNVHYSRVVHICDAPLQGKCFGIPRLNHVYNLLDDILKIGGGSAETYWLTANRGMQIDVDKDMDLDTDSAAELTAELDEFQHQLRRYIRTRGVKINTLGAEVADPAGVFSVLMALLAATTGIPQRILMGAEAGQLASEQDRSNWAEYMTRRHKQFAEPYVLRPLIDRFTALGILPATKAVIEFEWPSTFHQSPLERAQTMAQFARSVINLSRETEKSFPICTLKEARRALDLPEEVEKGDKLPDPPPEPVATGPFGKPIAGAPKQPTPAPKPPKGNEQEQEQEQVEHRQVEQIT